LREYIHMIDYITTNCVLPPLDEPSYDEATDMWELFFEESFPSWYKKDEDEFPSLICVNFESREELDKTLRQLENIEKERVAYETTTKTEEPVLS